MAEGMKPNITPPRPVSRFGGTKNRLPGENQNGEKKSGRVERLPLLNTEDLEGDVQHFVGFFFFAFSGNVLERDYIAPPKC